MRVSSALFNSITQRNLRGFPILHIVGGGRGAGAICKNLLVQREEAWGARVCCLSATVPKQPGQALTLLRLKLQHEGCTQASCQDLFCSLRRLGCLYQAISIITSSPEPSENTLATGVYYDIPSSHSTVSFLLFYP